MQSLLWDRRLVLAILDHVGVPTPNRAEINRDGGPRVPRFLRQRVRRDLGLLLPGHKAKDEDSWDPVEVPERWKGKRKKAEVPRARDVILREDGDAIIVNGTVIEKPFVEKPVNGEDHNVYIYYRGGGGRRLFRKVGNKSSAYDENLYHPRTVGSYIYEEFINVDNGEATYRVISLTDQRRMSRFTLSDHSLPTPKPASRLWSMDSSNVMRTAKRPAS